MCIYNGNNDAHIAGTAQNSQQRSILACVLSLASLATDQKTTTTPKNQPEKDSYLFFF